MVWNIKIRKSAEREIDKLNPKIAIRILDFLHNRLAALVSGRIKTY
jgi:mRNA-degrading endonuclease RelE of RelBE toxin-antitoxin system